ncbi:MAG: hypothetical protein LBS48_06455 [Treponema sp.]|jgi:hypothetical protein|nr:hypothetical protein [Treponema sp.]
MENFLPETLEPVGFFLQNLDTPEWLWTFRIAVAAVMVLTSALFLYFRKRLPRDDKPRKKKPQ